MLGDLFIFLLYIFRRLLIQLNPVKSYPQGGKKMVRLNECPS